MDPMAKRCQNDPPAVISMVKTIGIYNCFHDQQPPPSPPLLECSQKRFLKDPFQNRWLSVFVATSSSNSPGGVL